MFVLNSHSMVAGKRVSTDLCFRYIGNTIPLRFMLQIFAQKLYEIKI